jgi:hypothetical protein
LRPRHATKGGRREHSVKATPFSAAGADPRSPAEKQRAALEALRPQSPHPGRNPARRNTSEFTKAGMIDQVNAVKAAWE